MKKLEHQRLWINVILLLQTEQKVMRKPSAAVTVFVFVGNEAVICSVVVL